MKMTTKLMCLSAVAAAAFATVNSANAAVVATYELRIAGQTGAAAHAIQLTQPNQVLHLEAYIHIINTDANTADDTIGVASVQFFSTESAGGTLMGNYSNGLKNNTLFAIGANGNSNNLDGNPDLEWGGTVGTSTTGNMNPQGLTQNAQTGDTTGGVLLGTIDWTGPADPNAPGSDFLFVKYFRNASNTFASNLTMVVDGVNFGGSAGVFGALSNVDADTVLAVGAGVQVNAVPEPASLGVLALGGLALLARRRKTA